MKSKNATDVSPPAKIAPRRIRQLHAGDGRQRAGNAGFVEEADRGSAVLGCNPEEQHDAEDETPVANTIGDESFLGSGRGFFLIDIETNQQVRAESHAFPADEHQQEVVGQHSVSIAKHEEIQVSEEAIIPAVAMHVASGEDVNQQTNEVMKERKHH